MRFEPLEKRRLLSVNVTTARYDNAREGANTSETVLTTSNVNTASFGKIATMTTDAQVYTQPLIMTNVAVSGYGTRNVVYVATENDTVYAFDAQGNNPAQGYLWKTSLLNLDSDTSGETAVPETNLNTTDITPIDGVTGSPVIDPTTNTLYVVGFFLETNATYQQRLYALDITSGAVKFGGPATISATVAGYGNGSSGGVLSFSSLHENQRPALTLANGQVYIAWASHGDINPWHGWVMAYNATTLAQDYVLCLTPGATSSDSSADAGGVWMSGGGIAVDSGGNLYLTTGNGSFDANTTGGTDYGMTLLKLSPSLTPEDYFAPYNQASLSNADLDYGCSNVILLSNQSGSAANEVLSEGKWGTIYLNNGNTGSLGEYNANGTGPNADLGEANITGNLGNTTSDVHNTIAYWNGYVYSAGDALPLEAFAAGNSTLGTTPSSESSHVFGSAAIEDGQGAGLTVSSNGTSNGIVWALDNGGFNSNPTVLYAYSATNLNTVLWTSSQASGGRDTGPDAVKFQTPVVANGLVYVAGAGALTIYGLLPTVTTAAAASPAMVTGSTTNLSVAGSDPGTDLPPTYTWATTSEPSGATSPTFSANGTNSSNNPTATFYMAGSYTFTCAITDPTTNATNTSSVNVTVSATLTSGLTTINPSTATVVEGGSLQFIGGGSDQFGNPMSAPATWSVSAGGAGGTVDSNGFYTAPASVTGTDTVKATSGSISTTARVTVVAPATGTAQVNLSSYYNRDGIVPDGSSFSGGGIDTVGDALSGNLLGTSATFNGSTFTVAPAFTTADNVVYAAGQTITLSPQGNDAQLELLADHTNGSVTNKSLIVTYTDNSTQTFTQSFSDWFSGTTNDYNNESVAVTMGYRDLSTGATDARDFYVYGYFFALNTSKTIKSLTLPSDTNLEILAIDLAPYVAATQVSLSGNFNRNGITPDGSRFSTGGFDTGGYALSGTLLGTSQSFSGSTFTIAAASTTVSNVVYGTGQTITLTQGNYGQLELLADHTNGSNSDTLTVAYTDNSTQAFTQTFGDWTQGNNGYSGQYLDAVMSYRNQGSNGSKNQEKTYLYGYDLALNSSKTIESLTLPSDSGFEVVAIDLTSASSITTVSISTPASANPAAAGTSTVLSVGAVDPTGDAAPTYSWAATLTPSGAAAPTFSVNNSSSANSTTAAITQAGTYGFTVTVTDPTTGNTVLSSAKVVANFGIFTNSADIGSPSPAGALTYNSGTGAYATTAGGAGIGGTSDQFHYTYENLGSGGQITAYAASLTNSNAAAESGPMFRDSTAANGAFAEMAVTPSEGVVFQWRSSDGASAGSTSVAAVTAPVYLRLLETNGQASGYYSTDGTSWTQVGTTQTVSTSGSELAGLAVTSNSSGASTSAVIQNVSVVAAPTVVTPAAASPSPATSTTTNLSVLGADPTGEANLSCVWTVTGKPMGATTPTFSANSSNAAKNTTATFFQYGGYNFMVTITNAGGLSVTSTVSVTVNQTLTSITVTPATVTLNAGTSQQFAATAYDQFGNTIANPPAIMWSMTGGGTLSGSGLYQAPEAETAATITAVCGAFSSMANVNVPGQPEWIASGNGSWSTPGDWQDSSSAATISAPGLRGLAGSTALFSTALGTTVTLDSSSPSLATVTFDSSLNSYTIAPGMDGTGTLHLNNGANPASVVVAAGSNMISAPVALDSSLIVSPANGTTLTVSGPISGGGRSLTLDGGGSLVLSGGDSYSGGTIVIAGTLVVQNSGALDGSLVVGTNAGTIFGPSLAANAPLQPAVASFGVAAAAPVASPNVASVSPSLPAPVAVPVAAPIEAAAGNPPSPAILHDRAISILTAERQAGFAPAAQPGANWRWAPAILPYSGSSTPQDNRVRYLWDTVLAEYGPMPNS